MAQRIAIVTGNADCVNGVNFQKLFGSQTAKQFTRIWLVCFKF